MNLLKKAGILILGGVIGFGSNEYYHQNLVKQTEKALLDMVENEDIKLNNYELNGEYILRISSHDDHRFNNPIEIKALYVFPRSHKQINVLGISNDRKSYHLYGEIRKPDTEYASINN